MSAIFNSSLLILNLSLMFINLDADKIALALFNAFTVGVVFTSLLVVLFRKESK